jgi:hypothetical protein
MLARLLLAAVLALTCSGTGGAREDIEVRNFLARCEGLKTILTGAGQEDLPDQEALSWCTAYITGIVRNERVAAADGAVPASAGICLPDGITETELLMIMLDELQAHDRSAMAAEVITASLSVWWPCE